MDHFWAFVKTVASFLAWFFAACLFFLFAVYGIDFIGKLFTDHGQKIGAIFISLLILLFFVLEYFRHLDNEKEKHKLRKNNH